MRQRPFDEALRAELEWQSQIWKTYFWQPSCSTSSSHKWWQHEHQDSQWREHQDTQWRDHQWQDHQWWIRRIFQGISLNSDLLGKRRWSVDRTHRRTHIFLSWKSSALDSTLHTYMRACLLKSHPISQHVSQTALRHAWPISIILCHATADDTWLAAADWNQENPLRCSPGATLFWPSGLIISSHMWHYVGTFDKLHQSHETVPTMYFYWRQKFRTANKDYFRTHFFLESCKIPSQLQAECYACGPPTFVPNSWMCKKQAAVSHSGAGWVLSDAGLRMEGKPALQLWECAPETCFSQPDAKGNLTRQSGKRHSPSHPVDHFSFDATDRGPSDIPESSVPDRVLHF